MKKVTFCISTPKHRDKQTYTVEIPKGWKQVGKDPYKPVKVRKGDKYLDVGQLFKGKTVYHLVPKFNVGKPSVVFLLLIRKVAK